MNGNSTTKIFEKRYFTNKARICFSLTFITFSVIAQDCHHATLIKGLASAIPVNFCIPNGYLIDEIYEPADVNGDELPEYIFSWRRTSLQDGDTIFVSFYQNNGRNRFSHMKTLANLFPIYFRNYKNSSSLNDSSLATLHEKYNGWNPLQDLQITDNKIVIKMERSAGEGLIFTFEYITNDWFLKELREWTEDRDRNLTSRIIKAPNYGSSITKFGYFDYTY